jgi:endonuclease/exonuclease/phosphatase family metal-dependent hydrolase
MKILFTVLLMTSLLSASAQTISVMTYNIRLDTKSDGVNHWPLRTTKVYDLIKKYDPDIFGVQEALSNQMEDLLKNLPEYAFVGVGRDDGKTKGEYSAIFYKKGKFRIHKQNTFWLSETPEVPGSKSWDAAITRVATWAQLEELKSKRKFLFVNTHFDHIGQVAREKSAELIKVKVSELKKKLPVIITGDFNSEPMDPPYLTMTNGKILVVKDSRPATSTQGTFCSFGVNTMPCKTIDYIFHSVEWTATEYQVVQDNDGAYYPSDHLPVIVKLAINK